MNRRTLLKSGAALVAGGAVSATLRTADELTTDQQLQQVAALLAVGVLRWWKARQLCGQPTSAEIPKSAEQGLEVRPETSLTGASG